MLGGGELEDRKVQMRCVFRGISRGSDVGDDLAFLDLLSFAQTHGVPLEVSVVITVLFRGVELINRRSPRFALKETGDGAVLDRLYRCIAGRENVDRLVRARSAPPILERPHQVVGL